MKWALAILAAGALPFLFLPFRPSSDLAPYETQPRPLTAPERHLTELWSGAGRKDAAGWVARVELA
ncbi:MAG: hypothetical protein ABDI20_00965, partial [Candidatus Bipolaricaulaceae bacterium]